GGGAGGIMLQGPRALSRAGPGDCGPCDALSARALGHAGWTHRPGPIAGRDRWPFRPRTAPLRADALPSGAIDAAAVGGVVAVGGRVHLEATGATPADGQTGRVRRRSASGFARRAGDLALCVGG